MKNWKYIQVGNYDAQEKLGLKPVPKTIPVNEHDKKTILEIYEKAGRNYDRAKRMIKEKFIGFDDNAAKTALESVIGSNGKGLNESIYKQEASLFGGLGEKAEKEIGNAISDYSVVTTKDGYFVYKKGQKVGGPFQNEEQAKTFAAQLQTKDPQWTNKTGNADTVSEYNAEIQRLTKKAEELRRMGQGRSAMEIEKQIEKLGKELRELGNSKTGNETPEEMEVKYKGYTITYFPYQKKYMVRHPSEVSGLIQKHFTSVDEAKKAIDKKLVGNATPGSIASIGPAWMHGGTVYGKMDTDESGKKHNEYVKITWLGEGKGGVANYFIDDRMQSDKFGSLDKNELKRWAEQKVHNETKGERKFGKVMGEFEEGALKTPQGKTVTDPAQAKAIAYSEADKVDNLKRARNAIVKNQQVTLWNGNDTVLISEDGTVQYLESNSFEVDRDKYDSQQMAIEEMTKKGYRKK